MESYDSWLLGIQYEYLVKELNSARCSLVPALMQHCALFTAEDIILLLQSDPDKPALPYEVAEVTWKLASCLRHERVHETPLLDMSSKDFFTWPRMMACTSHAYYPLEFVCLLKQALADFRFDLDTPLRQFIVNKRQCWATKPGFGRPALHILEHVLEYEGLYLGMCVKHPAIESAVHWRYTPGGWQSEIEAWRRGDAAAAKQLGALTLGSGDGRLWLPIDLLPLSQPIAYKLDEYNLWRVIDVLRNPPRKLLERGVPADCLQPIIDAMETLHNVPKMLQGRMRKFGAHRSGGRSVQRSRHVTHHAIAG